MKYSSTLTMVLKQIYSLDWPYSVQSALDLSCVQKGNNNIPPRLKQTTFTCTSTSEVFWGLTSHCSESRKNKEPAEVGDKLT